MDHVPPTEIAIAVTIVHLVLCRLVMRLRNLALYGFNWYPMTVFIGSVTWVGAWIATHRGVTGGGMMWLTCGIVVAGAAVQSVLLPEGALSIADARERLDLLATALSNGDAECLRRAVASDGYQAVAAWLWPAVRWVRQEPPPPHDQNVAWASKRLQSASTGSC